MLIYHQLVRTRSVDAIVIGGATDATSLSKVQVDTSAKNGWVNGGELENGDTSFGADLLSKGNVLRLIRHFRG